MVTKLGCSMGRCGEHEAQGTGSVIKHAPDLTVRGKESELHERSGKVHVGGGVGRGRKGEEGGGRGRKGEVDVHGSVYVIGGKGSSIHKINFHVHQLHPSSVIASRSE